MSRQATKSQLYSLHLISQRSFDTRSMDISYEDAKILITRGERGDNIIDQLELYGAKKQEGSDYASNITISPGDATKRQRWALYQASERTINTQDMKITKQKASDLIKLSMSGENINDELIKLGGVSSSSKVVEKKIEKSEAKIVAKKHDSDKSFQEIWNKVEEAAINAAKKATHVPVGVESFDYEKAWTKFDGECGFAHIKIKASTAFGQWLLKKDLAFKSHDSGILISFKVGQSYERNVAACNAGASVLNRYSLKTDVWSKVD